MTTKILQVARFTAQQVADAVARIYGAPIEVSVVELDGVLYYSVTRSDSKDLPTLLTCSQARLVDICAAASDVLRSL